MRSLENIEQLVYHKLCKFICIGISDKKFIVYVLRNFTKHKPIEGNVEILSYCRCICKVRQKFTSPKILQSTEWYTGKLGNIFKCSIPYRIKPAPKIQNANFFPSS